MGRKGRSRTSPRRIPGSGGAHQVVIIEAPAVATNGRAYRHGAGG